VNTPSPGERLPPVSTLPVNTVPVNTVRENTVRKNTVPVNILHWRKQNIECTIAREDIQG